MATKRLTIERGKMNLLQKVITIGSLALVAAVGCEKKPQEIVPGNAGERNENCQAKNDCKAGLSCISGRCQPTNYDGLEVSGKECIRHQCDEIEDCCGDKPSDPPSKCAGVESICSTPTILDCSSNSYCTDDSDCGSGDCVFQALAQRCSISDLSCTSDANCYDDTCELYNYGTGGEAYTIGYCTISNETCGEDADCFYNGDSCPEAGYADSGYCDCTNPDYDPSDEICTDEDCEDVCNLTCESNLCVEDDSCEDDDECPSFAPFCDDGACVECTADDECDEDADEECRSGVCERPCEFDQECPNFSACESGECVYKGCDTNTDCVLLYGEYNGARLAECVQRNGIGECRLPCDTDAHCDETSVCDQGFCEYIGCQTDGQCDRLLGLANQEVTEDRPFVTSGQCVDLESPASGDGDGDGDGD